MRTILFQGDSITDAGRDRSVEGPNSSCGLGRGYAARIAGRLLRQHPLEGWRFFNRGVSGDRIVDVYARWKLDAIRLKPDMISLLVGVNDTWHEFSRGNGVELDRYEAVYRMLLDYTRRERPATAMVLCEPFVAVSGVVTRAWTDDVRRRGEIVARLAKEFGACFVPFQSVIDRALDAAPAAHWLEDGVHPTPAGHELLAECWLEYAGGLA